MIYLKKSIVYCNFSRWPIWNPTAIILSHGFLKHFSHSTYPSFGSSTFPSSEKPPIRPARRSPNPVALVLLVLVPYPPALLSFSTFSSAFRLIVQAPVLPRGVAFPLVFSSPLYIFS